MEKKHECTIGHYNSSSLDSDMFVTEDELKSQYKSDCEDAKRFNEYVVEHELGDCMKRTEYQWKDLFDGRKTTPLKRFAYCPYCGTKIDWNRIKEIKSV